ncbi:MAG TPA: DUF4339 domain-containing protein [Verrucomicrobiae bacterium]|jgi:hypothetical protein
MANYIIIGGDGKEYGPISSDDVRQWMAEGRLNQQSLAKAESDAEFRPLEKFPEFSAAFTRPAPETIAPLILTADEWVGQVTTRQPELRLGECLAAGWSFLGANVGFLVGAVILAWLINLVFVFGALYLPILGPLAALCFSGVIMGGFYLACLRRLRGENVAVTDVLSGFKDSFPQLLLTGLIAGLLTELSACCLILPAIYLGVAWSLAIVLVADKKMFFWSAMELSRKVITKVWFEMFVLLIIAFLPMILFQIFNLYRTGTFFFGLYDQANHDMQQLAKLIQDQSQTQAIRTMALQVTLIGQAIFLVNLFYCAGVIVRAYENLFGSKKT